MRVPKKVFALFVVVALIWISAAVWADRKTTRDATINTTAVRVQPVTEGPLDTPLLGDGLRTAQEASQEAAEPQVDCLLHVDEGWFICDDGRSDDGRGGQAPITYDDVAAILEQEPTSLTELGLESGWFVGWAYNGANYTGAKLSLFSNYSCSNHNHLVPDLAPAGFANTITSARANTVASCGNMDLYANSGYGGASYTCSPANSNLTGVGFNNNAESVRIRA